MKNSSCVCCGILWFLIGTLFVIIGIVGTLLLSEKLHPSILKQDVVTSKSSENYPKWVTNDFEGAPDLYQGFTLYNLTNPYDVLNNAATPIYEEIGPFIYRAIWTRLNVTWSEDKNFVTYWMFQQFILNETLSVADPNQTVICNFNPAYLGAITQAGSDLDFTIGYTGVVLRNYVTFLTTTFTTGVILQNVPTYLQEAENALSDNGSAFFFETWANATNDPDPRWEGMRVSDHTPSEISMESAEMLFNPNVSYSLMDMSNNYKTWLYAMSGNSSCNELLCNTFNLTSTQLNMVLIWLNSSFVQIWVNPQIEQNFQIDDISDLGYLQWGQGGVTQVSVQQLYPEFNFPTIPEYALWWDQDFYEFTMDVQTSKLLLNGTNGLFVPQNVGTFWKVVASRNWTLVEELWGLTEAMTLEFSPYFFDQAYNASTIYLKDLFEQGGGLISNRTVHEWLWTAVDPLLAQLQPGNAAVHFVFNDTSEQQVLSQQMPSTTYTGNSDPNLIMWYTVFEGKTNYTNYPSVIEVGGTTPDGQFPPFLSPFQRLSTWSEDHFRNIPLIPVAELDVQGLKTYRYEIDNTTFMVDPDYYQYIRGFCNMTSVKGAPIFLGFPHMMIADDRYRKKITGMLPPDPDRDLTSVDIEPYTGKVVRVNKSLQVNAYIPAGSQYSTYNPGLATDIMYPLFWGFERSEITPPLASQLKSQLYTALSLQQYLLPVFVPVGAFLLIIGFSLTVFMGCLSYRCRQVEFPDGYEKIRED